MDGQFYMKNLMERFGVSRDTIKYYEAQGLIKSRRDANGYRRFDPVMAAKLDWILRLRAMDFSVKQIKRIIVGGKMRDDGERMFNERISEIDRMMQKLERMKKELLVNREFSKSFQDYYRNCHRYDCGVGCWTAHTEGVLFYLDDAGEIEREEPFGGGCAYPGDAGAHGVFGDTGTGARGGPERSEGRLPDGKKAMIRNIIKQSESAYLAEVIRDMVRWGKQNGYATERRLYCFYTYYFDADDTEGIALDLYLPLQNAAAEKGRDAD